MPRTCTVCAHPDSHAINKALIAGEPFRGLAAKYRVSEDALARHKAGHLPVTLVQAHDAADVSNADDLLAQVRELQTKARGILDQAEAAGDLRTALGAIREARGNLELLAKLLGELDTRPTVNLLVAPEWLTVRAAILAALTGFPDARVAVAHALTALEAPNAGR